MLETNTWTLAVRLRHAVYQANGAEIASSLPGVQVFNPSSPFSDTAVVTTLHLPHFGDYDWSEGPSPVGNRWSLTLAEQPLSLAVGGSDSHAVSTDSLRVFVSGALLGIAGGALVGSAQELLSVSSPTASSRRWRRRRRGRRAAGPDTARATP